MAQSWMSNQRRLIERLRLRAPSKSPLLSSNLIDRAFRDGHVVDCLILNLGALHTGVFNLADIAIMTGAGALLLTELRKRNQT